MFGSHSCRFSLSLCMRPWHCTKFGFFQHIRRWLEHRSASGWLSELNHRRKLGITCYAITTIFYYYFVNGHVHRTCIGWTMLLHFTRGWLSYPNTHFIHFGHFCFILLWKRNKVRLESYLLKKWKKFVFRRWRRHSPNIKCNNISIRDTNNKQQLF